MALQLDNIGSGFNLSKLNTNFQKIEDSINNDTLRREVGVGDANEMRTFLDMNNNTIVNSADGEEPQSLVTKRQLDASLTTTEALDMKGFKIINLEDGIDPQDAVNKGQLDLTMVEIQGLVDEAANEADASEASAIVSASNANFAGKWSLQTGAKSVPYAINDDVGDGNDYQLLVNIPDITIVQPSLNPSLWKLIATATTIEIITWNRVRLTHDVTIPDDRNASSVGPSIEIADNTTVTIGNNSNWSIL